MWIHRGLRANTIYIVKRRCDQRLFTKIFHIVLAGLIFSQNALYPLISALPAPPPAYAQESPPSASDSATLPTQAGPPLVQAEIPLINLDTSPTTPSSPQISQPESLPEAQPESNLFNVSLRYPFSGEYPITYHFGERSDDAHVTAMQSEYRVIGHEGIDFGLPMGTEVQVVDAGVVETAGSGNYGFTVVVRHDWGTSYYGHLSQVLVNQGDQIGRSHVIGRSGNSGNSTGPHLHFGIKPKNANLGNGYHGMVDPALYLRRPAVLGAATLLKHFEPKTRRAKFRLMDKSLESTQDNLQLNLNTVETKPLSLTLTDPRGNTEDISSLVLGQDQVAQNRTLSIPLDGDLMHGAGKYTLTLTDEKGYYDQQDFTWGVLALNPNKSVYKSGDLAKLAMAVLDEQGEMVCDAAVVLKITSPTGARTTLTTAGGQIQVNEEVCQSKDFTLDPDYQTEYATTIQGTYKLTLTATTASGSYSIQDQFQVDDSVPFDVERTSATRLYPSYTYPMTLSVTPSADFRGTVIEHLGEGVTPVGDTRWQVDWQAGVTYNLSYSYDVPDISPEFYHLGGLEFVSDNGVKVYAQDRKWQLAIDAVEKTVGFFSPPTSWTSAGNANLALPQPDPRNGDLMLATISIRPSGSTVDTPSGWTLLESRTGTDGGSEGADAGSVGTYVFYKVADGSEGTGTVTFTETGTTSVWIGNISKVRSATGTYDLDSAGYSISGDATNWGGTLDSDPGLAAGDLVILLAGQVGDASNTSAWGVSAAGITSTSSVNEHGEYTSTTGNDIEVGIAATLVWTGTNSATPTLSLTQSASVSGTVTAVRIRQGSGTNRSDNWVRSAGPETAGTTSVAVLYPEHEIGDLLVLFVGSRISTDATPTTPTGWTSLGSYNGGTGTFGADAGNSRTTVYYLHTGLRMTGSQTVSLGSGNSMIGRMIAVHRDADVTWDLDIDGGTDSTADTSWSATGSGLDLDSADGGDIVLVGSSTNTDAYTYSAAGLSASGIGVGETTVAAQFNTANGNDMNLTIAMARITSGSGSAAPTYTMTSSGTAGSAPTGSSAMVAIGSTPVAATITISGTANGNSGASVRYAYDGVLQADTSDTISGGTWSLDNVTEPTANQIITVWVDGVGDSSESTAVTKWSSGDVTGMVLDTNIVTVGSSEDTSLTLTNLNTYDCSEDEDIMYQAASSTLKVEGDACAGSTTNSYSAEELEILSGDTLTVGGSETLTTYDLTITGTLTSGGNSTYNVAHNWAKTGTFTQSTSTVNLNGAGGTTQTLSGTTTFYTLSATASNARTIKFPSSVTTTVSNSLTLTGASSQLLTLDPGTAATTWTLSAPATTSVSYVSVSYSTSSGSSFCATSSADGGNNTSWLITTGATCQDGSYSFQRKTWYDGTRYWRSAYDSTDARIEFEYSTDGSSWTEDTSARITTGSSDFSVQADSSNAFIAYTNGYDIEVRKASSYPGTSFSWGSATVTYDGSSATNYYHYPTLAYDTNSKVWVNAMQYETGTIDAFITADDNDGTEEAATTWHQGGYNGGGQNYHGYYSGNDNSGYRFVSLTIPQGAQIDSATLSLRGTSIIGAADAVKLKVSATDADNPGVWSSSNRPSQQTKTSAQVDWDLSSWSTSGYNTSPSITSVIQEIVDRSGWSSGNAIAINVMEDGTTGGNNEVAARDYNGDTSQTANLDVTYTAHKISVRQSTFTNDISSWDTATTLDSSTSSTKYGTIVPRTSGAMYAVWTDGTALEGKNYNGTSWDASPTSIDTVPGNLQDSFSAVGDGSGNVYLEYIDDEATDQVSVAKYNGTSWGSAALVADAADNNDSYPTLTYDSTGSDLYTFWVDTSSSDIYYAKCDVSTNCDTAAEWDSEVAWQTSGTNTYVTSNYSGAGYIFASWLDGSTLTWDKVLPPNNTAPNSPSILAQKTTADVTLATGDWHNTTSIKFTATATDTDNPDTLYLCVEKDLLGTSFSNTEDSCGSGVSYTGTGVSVTHTISSQTDVSEYHWQARIKDTAGAYSAWISYGGNAESARDYGIDTTAPTGGTVYDGTGVGVDVSYNDGSLSSLSANWASFNSNVAGLSKYQYSIGTTAGGTNIKGWTDNGTTTSVTASGLTLQTNQLYYTNVRAVDLAGNTGNAVSSDGQLVAPSLNFSVSPGTVTFNNLNPGNSYTDTEDTTLTTSTNAYGGYVVRAFVTDYLRSTTDNFTIPDFSGGTYASPATWGSGTGLGYTSSDMTIQGSNLFSSGTLYAPFSHTAPGDIVADHTSTVTGTPISGETFTITYKVQAADTQPAHKYTSTVVYTITAQY